ncbi:MAG TPA: hypothetical protein VE032_01420 [Actinomycetota bacterium]|nr:hypothetical protein [Actinomycetota bacterium]
MTKLDDVRKTVGSKVGSLTPARARDMARDLLEPGAAKERVDKVTGDLLEWSQRNGERIREMVRREIGDQLGRAGLATQADVDALTKRVRSLERSRASTTSRSSAAKKPSATKRAAAKKDPASG